MNTICSLSHSIVEKVIVELEKHLKKDMVEVYWVINFMEKVSWEQLFTSFHNINIGRHAHFFGTNKQNSFSSDIARLKLYMDQKNHDFMNSVVLFSRSAVTIKQKSLLATEG